MRRKSGDEQFEAICGLVDLAEDGIQSLSAARAVLHKAATAGDAVVVSDAPHELAEWRASQLETFRMELRTFLRGIVASGAADDKGSHVPNVTMQKVEIGTVVAGSTVVMTVDAAARDLLWFQIIDVIRTVGVGRIRACGVCGRLFIRSGRRTHCSTQCAQNARAKAFYQANRAAISKRRHARYKAKIKADRPTAVVHRRPRVTESEKS